MQIAEADEAFSDFYLEGKEEEMKNPSNILSAIRRIMISLLCFHSFNRKLTRQVCCVFTHSIESSRDKEFALIPVFCGSSLKNKGVRGTLGFSLDPTFARWS